MHSFLAGPKIDQTSERLRAWWRMFFSACRPGPWESDKNSARTSKWWLDALKKTLIRLEKLQTKSQISITTHWPGQILKYAPAMTSLARKPELPRSVQMKRKYLVTSTPAFLVRKTVWKESSFFIHERGHIFGQALTQWRAFSLAAISSSMHHLSSRSGHLSRCYVDCSDVPHSQAVSAASA